MKYVFQTEEKEEAELIMQAGALHSALWEMAADIRNNVKHGEEGETLTWDEVREWFYNHLDDVKL